MEASSQYQEKYNSLLINTFKYVVEFLNSHNLRWFCCYGTLLGAVRHKGRIPWDDDIDICMPKEDFEKLRTIKDEIEKDHYKFVSLADKGYHYAIGQIFDTNTTLWEREVYPFIKGVYVDIFPLYRTELAGERLADSKRMFKYRFISTIRTVKQIPFTAFMRSFFIEHDRKWREFIINLLFYPRFTYKYYYNKFKKYDDQLNMDKGETVLSYPSWEYGDKDLMDYRYFSDYIEVPFEDFTVRIPVGYHDYLTKIYGDYMTPPPIEKRGPKHDDLRYYINLNEGLSLAEVKKRIKRGEKKVY